MPRFVTLEEFAAAARMSYKAAGNLVRSGQVRAIRTAKRWLIEEADARAYFDSLRNDHTSHASQAVAV